MATNAYTTLVAATTTAATPNNVDFGQTVRTVAWQIVPAGTIVLGAVTVQVSLDGVTWSTPPTASLTNLSGATVGNPYTLVTGTPALFVAADVAARYARAIVSTNITGTGASVTVLVSGA